jgi:hypothetical protein
MKLPTLGFAFALLALGVSAAGKYKCETGTNHHAGDSCHGSVGDYACDPYGNVVSKLFYRSGSVPLCLYGRFILILFDVPSFSATPADGLSTHLAVSAVRVRRLRDSATARAGKQTYSSVSCLLS